MKTTTSGSAAASGSFRCASCAYVLTLGTDGRLPRCPSCGAESFVGATVAGRGRFAREAPGDVALEDREHFLAEARALVTAPGEHLAYSDGGEVRVLALTREWTRVGRSLAADVRFDDTTVSRRHALLVRQADGVRVVDDRSMNGIFVNGLRVEWRTLRDGDELTIGRHHLLFLTGPEDS